MTTDISAPVLHYLYWLFSEFAGGFCHHCSQEMGILRDFLLYRLLCQITTHLAGGRAEGRRVNRTPTLPHLAGAARTSLNKKGGRVGSDLSLQTQQIPHQRAHAEAGPALSNVGTLFFCEGRTGDIKVSPRQATNEFFEKES